MLRTLTFFSFVLFAGCAATVPTPSVVGSGAVGRVTATVTTFVARPVRASVVPDAEHMSVVKAREFRVPGRDLLTTSIVAGPGRNLWFTKLRHIGYITTGGEIHEVMLRQTQAIPEALTVGSDGYVWANAGGRMKPRQDDSTGGNTWGGTMYQLFKVDPALHVQTFYLPLDTNGYPNNLVRIGPRLYTARTLLTTAHGTDFITGEVDRVNEDGTVTPLFPMTYTSNEGGTGWVRLLATPDKKIWLYDYLGGIHGCTTGDRCTYTFLGPAEFYVGSLQGTLAAYSPTDRYVYVCDSNTSTIYKTALSGKHAGKYRNLDIGFGLCAMTYYHHDIWVTLNGDSEDRPMLGRLTPSGKFYEMSLPFKGGYVVSAMAAGPDGHLWYLRGHSVGEILSAP